MNNNVLEKTVSAGLGLGTEQLAANMMVGGQLGLGLNPSALDAATPLMFPPAVLVVTHVPTMWKADPKAGQMLKALIETHPKAVSGIDFGYTLETTEQELGHDGQKFEVPTQTKRSAVEPSFTFHEVGGNLIWNFFRQWVWDIQHPDTIQSMARFEEIDPFMSSAYSMSMMAIQFDPTMRPENIIDGMFYSNMFPKDPGGQFGIERQIGATKSVERAVTFSGHVQHDKATRELAVKIAKQLQLAKVNYDRLNPGTEEVSKSLGDTGLEREVKEFLDYPTA